MDAPTRDISTTETVASRTRAGADARLPLPPLPEGASVPLRLGPYRIVGELGSGGMGVVYRATQDDLGRDVALKVIRDAWVATDADRQRLRVEARVAGSLRHPGLVTVHEIDEQDGQLFFSMELVEGPSLAALVARRGPLDPAEAARLIGEVAEAIAHAHERAVVHRDLKPANVLIDVDGRARVADFGIAGTLGRTPELAGEIAGTPGWMAPEVVAGDSGADSCAVDIHGLGALLYFAVTGHAPFEAATHRELLIQVVEHRPIVPRRLRPGLPRDLQAICMRCLEKEPSRRYSSASDVAADLARFLAAEPVAARPRDAVSALRRWVAARPSLAFTWIGLAAFYANEWMSWIHFRTADLPALHERSHAVVAGWAVAAGLLQAWLERSRAPGVVHAAWATLEIALLTQLVIASIGPRSSLVIAYPLVILASAFRMRPWLCWWSATASLLGYATACAEASLLRPHVAVAPGSMALTATSLLLFGLMTSHLARRLRVVSGLARRRRSLSA